MDIYSIDAPSDLQRRIDSIAAVKAGVDTGDTIYLNIATAIVGAEDNSAAWNTAFSDYFAIPTNKLLHLEFVNHGSGVNNWNNWNLAIANEIADRDDSGYEEYFVLRYAAVPDYGTITKDSLVGTWEHINLKYSYGLQDAASSLILNANGTMSGALTGNWSYDVTKKQLILGNVIVCVEREVDWEATPRCVTFVYAGTEKNLNATYWGKKKK